MALALFFDFINPETLLIWCKKLKGTSSSFYRPMKGNYY